jgi:hypothetical protein
MSLKFDALNVYLPHNVRSQVEAIARGHGLTPEAERYWNISPAASGSSFSSRHELPSRERGADGAGVAKVQIKELTMQAVVTAAIWKL